MVMEVTPRTRGIKVGDLGEGLASRIIGSRSGREVNKKPRMEHLILLFQNYEYEKFPIYKRKA